LLALALPQMAQVWQHVKLRTINVPVSMAIAGGAMIGAPLGSYAAQGTDDPYLRYAFAAFLCWTGARTLRRLPRRA